MNVLYVTSELPGQGSTALCYSIRNLSRKGGLNVKIAKIISSMPTRDLASNNYEKLFPQDQNGLSVLLLNEASRELKDLAKSCDLLLVEAETSISLEDQKNCLSDANAEVVVVSDYVNGTLCAEFAKRFDTNLKGVIINFMPRFAETEVRKSLIPEFESLDVKVMGVIPEDRFLLSLSVGQIAEYLGGRFFSGEDLSDGLVQNFMVGGFGMDPGRYAFSTRSNKAVVIRGDRPDVQMSALETDVTCFIMTNGIAPIEYVKYESQEEEVPILIVEKDTMQTMEEIGTLQRNARFDRPEKLERMSNLVDEFIGLERLTGGV